MSRKTNFKKFLWPPTGGGGGEGEERPRLRRTLLYQEYTTRVAQIPGLNIIDHSTSLADFSAPRAGGAKTGNERKTSETLAPLTRPNALAGNEPLTRPTALAGNEPLTRPTAPAGNEPLTRPSASVSSEPVVRPAALTANGPLFREQVHCKKRLAVIPSPAGMSLSKLSIAEK
jgi:hypothetical protein